MFRKFAVKSITAIALTIAPANYVAADLGDALIGGVVGGVVGGVIVNEANKKKQPAATTTSTGSKTYSSDYNYAQRQENRDVQTALNYFNYPAGPADGVFGRRTRSAVSSYQVFMGYPATGQLTEFQKTVLLNSYHRGIAGGAGTSEVIASSPYGLRGLLKHTQQEMAGGAGTTVSALETETAPAAYSLPSFGNTPEGSSMANHCNKISLITNTNGGYTNVSNIQDPVFALNEQFCLARIYAISKSEDMIGQVQGVSSAQMQSQCETLGPAFKEQISALSLGGRDQVMAKTSSTILAAGLSPAQLTHTAKICLGIGYRTDNSDVALASTLILVALGEPAYGELLGHHLVNGFGTAQRNDLAVQWYASAMDAIVSGQPAVFVPGQTDRPALIQAAAMQLGTSATGAEGQSATFVLPTFNSGASTD